MNDSSGTGSAGTSESEEPGRERARILAEVKARVEAADSIADFHEALELLPPRVRGNALLFLFAPELAIGPKGDAGPPPDEIEVFRTLSDRIRQVATEDDLAELRSRFFELVQATSARSFELWEDRLRGTMARTSLDVLNEQLKVRVVGGPPGELGSFDVTKPVEEWLAFGVSLIQWAREAMEETAGVKVDPIRFLDAEALEKRFLSLREELTRIEERFQGLKGGSGA